MKYYILYIFYCEAFIKKWSYIVILFSMNFPGNEIEKIFFSWTQLNEVFYPLGMSFLYL